MTTATELYALAELYNAHLVAILLAKESDGTQFASLIDGHITVVLQGDILADARIDYLLHAAQFLGCHLLEV